MLKSSLCDNGDACILFKETVTIPASAAAGATNNTNKKAIIKNCAPFTKYVSEIIQK